MVCFVAVVASMVPTRKRVVLVSLVLMGVPKQRRFLVFGCGSLVSCDTLPHSISYGANESPPARNK